MIELQSSVTGTMTGGTVMTSASLSCEMGSVIIVCAGCETTSGSAPAITSVQSSVGAMAFTKRGPGFYNGQYQAQEMWYLVVSEPFSDTITVTYAGAVDSSAMVALAYSGVDLAVVWNTVESYPLTASGTWIVNLDTTHSNLTKVIAFGATWTANAPTGTEQYWLGLPYGNRIDVSNPGGTNPENIYVADGDLFVPYDFPMGFLGGDANSYILMDALIGAVVPGSGGTAPYGQMYLPMPDAWADAINSTVMKSDCYAEIWSGLQPIDGAFANTLLLGGIRVVAGSVTVDRNSSVRRAATNVTLLPDPAGKLLSVVNALPTDDTGLFAPFGAEMRIYKGYKLPGTTPANLTSAFSPTPAGFAIIAAGVNDTFDFTDPGGGTPEVFTIAPGTYYSWAAIATAIEDATGSVSGEPFSTYCNVTTNSITFTFTLVTGGSAGNGVTITDGATTALPVMGLYSPSTFMGGADTGNLYASLGVFMIEEVDVINDANGLVFNGTLKDRMQWLSRRTLTAPYSSGANIPALGTVNLLVELACAPVPGVLPIGVPFPQGYVNSEFAMPVTSYNVGDDITQACQTIIAAIGYEFYFDYSGALVACPVPDPAVASSCISYLEATKSGPISIKRVVSIASVPNIISAVSQGSGVPAPVRVFWWESNPAYPSFYADPPAGGFATPVTVLAPLDPASRYPTSLLVLTTTAIGAGSQDQQAQAMVNAAGYVAQNSLESTTFLLRSNAAQDVDDIITAQRVVAGIPVDTKYVVDRVVIDLGVLTPMQVTGRPVVS